MPAYKDSRQGTWYASFYFENWQGVKQKKLKRTSTYCPMRARFVQSFGMIVGRSLSLRGMNCEVI